MPGFLRKLRSLDIPTMGSARLDVSGRENWARAPAAGYRRGGGHAGTCGFSVSCCGNKFARLTEAIRRHAAVYSLIVARLDDVRFVPDADIASAASDPAVEIHPGRPVFLISCSRIGFQVLEGAPVLHDDASDSVVPQKSRFGMSFELLQHFRHGEKSGKPFMKLPRFVDS